MSGDAHEDLRRRAEALREENAELRLRLDEATEALEAIRTGQVDSLVIEGPEGPRVFALEGAAQSYRVLVEEMNEGAATLSEDGTILYCNGCLARLLGTPLERTMGSSFVDRVPRRLRPAFRALLERAREADVREEMALTSSTGSAGLEIPVYLSVSAMLDGGRRLFCLVVTDLRAQRKSEALVAAERAARESEERLRRLLGAIAEGYYSADPSLNDVVADRWRAEDELIQARQRLAVALKAGGSGTFDWDIQRNAHTWSPEIEELYGLAPGELASTSEAWEALVFPDDLEAAKAMTAEALETGQLAGEWRVRRRRDGELRWLAAQGKVYYDDRGDPVRMIGIHVDITERKLQEAKLRDANLELERSNRDLAQFAYAASHDLQEPLRTIASFLQLIERRYRDKLDAEGLEFIDFAVDGARRMRAMIQDLLAFSRVERRGGEFGPTGLEETLNAAVENLRTAVADSGATVTHDPLPVVCADPAQMLQLLQNLIGNALKFRGARAPKVHVSARRDGPIWEVSVRDNGIGIEPQYHDRIFIIFQRLHTMDEYPGTGMGLAICKKIVERHGGRIWLESTPGEGSTFFFTLPANERS